MPLTLTEKAFQAQVVQLAKLRNWDCYHTWLSVRSEPGFPDLVLVRDRVLFRELKRDGGVLTRAQLDWQAKLRVAGADVAVWRPEDMPQIVATLSAPRLVTS